MNGMPCLEVQFEAAPFPKSTKFSKPMPKPPVALMDIPSRLSINISQSGERIPVIQQERPRSSIVSPRSKDTETKLNPLIIPHREKTGSALDLDGVPSIVKSVNLPWVKRNGGVPGSLVRVTYTNQEEVRALNLSPYEFILLETSPYGPIRLTVSDFLSMTYGQIVDRLTKSLSDPPVHQQQQVGSSSAPDESRLLSWLEQDPSILKRLLDKLSNNRPEFHTPTGNLIDFTAPETPRFHRNVDMDADDETMRPQSSAIVELADDTNYVMSELEIVELLDSEEDSSTTEPLIG